MLEASGALEAGPDPAYDFLAKLAADSLDMPIGGDHADDGGRDRRPRRRRRRIRRRPARGLPLPSTCSTHRPAGPRRRRRESEPHSRAASSSPARAWASAPTAASPLVTGDGHVLGAISVADTAAARARRRRRRDPHPPRRPGDGEHGAQADRAGPPAHGPAPQARGATREGRKLGVGPGVRRGRLVGRHLRGLRGRTRNPDHLRLLPRPRPPRRPRACPAHRHRGGRAARRRSTTRPGSSGATARFGCSRPTARSMSPPTAPWSCAGPGATSPTSRRTASDLKMRTELLDRVESAAVVALDVDGIVTHWNHGAELLYGWAQRRGAGPDGRRPRACSPSTRGRGASAPPALRSVRAGRARPRSAARTGRPSRRS